MNGTRSKEPSRTFWQDLADCWQQLPNKALFFTLLAAWLALFQFLGNSILGYIHSPSLFSWMYEAYNGSTGGSDDAHGNLIPFLVVGLMWWKRKELLGRPLNLWWPGFLVVGVAILLHVVGYVLQQPRLSVLALFTGIYGFTGMAWGRRWLRQSVFPFFLFGFSVPLGSIAAAITFPLRLLVTWLTELVAHGILGIGVIRQGTVLMDPSGAYQYEVAAACSGIRSLVAIFLLATIFGFVAFRSTWQRLFLMALAFPFAILGNLLRMLCIIFAAELGGESAGNYVHEGCPIHVPLLGDVGVVNLLPYVPAIIGLLWVGRWMEKRWPAEPVVHNQGGAHGVTRPTL